MPANSVGLPKNKDALVQTINNHFDREFQRMQTNLTMMRVIWHYLAGARNFKVIDLQNGMVKADIYDDEGKIDFQSSDLLRAIDKVVGYMKSYDLSNKVTGEGHSLSAIKDSAVGQAISDAAFSTADIERANDEFLNIYAAYGSCGIMAHVDSNPASGLGLTADIEVVHPSELVPFPSPGMDLSKVTGIGRQYFVPLEVLVAKLGSKVNGWVKDMYAFRVEPGEDVKALHSGEQGAWWTSESLTASAGAPATSETSVVYVRLRELWLDGPRGTCSRKICVSGDKLIQDLNFEDIVAYRPVGFARFINNGTFHGAGMFHVLFGVARNLERLNKSVFQQVTDMEQFGCLVLPQGGFNVNATLKTIGKGLKVLPWEPDPMDGGQKPFMIQPVNVGDSNTRTAVYAQQYFNSINPIVDIIKEKGRVDSGSGLSFLQEQVDRAMTNPTWGVIKAYGEMYKSALAAASKVLVEQPGSLPVTRLTLELAGAKIDWETNTVMFPQNPLPSIARLVCRPKLAQQRSRAQRKAESIEYLKLGISDPTRFFIKSIEESWDLPMWMDDYENAYKSFVRNALTLYNDGATPGMLVENPAFVKPELQAMLCKAFLASPKIAVASVKVQKAFIEYYNFLVQQSGRTLPDGLPYNPDDLAALLVGAQGAQDSMPPAQGGMPMTR